MALAQLLLAKPLMSNHNRGLWGYSGETPDGRPLTVQSTGMGGPSAAIVLHELAELGVRRAIRVGTCGALDDSLELGALLRVQAALPEDGVSRALGARARSRPTPACWAGWRPRGRDTGDDRDHRSLLRVPDDPRARWIEAGAAAVEMEACAMFTLAPGWGSPSAACWW